MEIILFLGFLLSRVLNVLLRPVYAYYFRRGSMKLPPVDDELLVISAAKLVDMILDRQVTSEQVVKAYIKRVREVDPILNAVVEERFDAALAEAKGVDEIVSGGNFARNSLKAQKPLFGVPVTVKESCSVRGLSLTGCSLTRIGVKAFQDGDAVANLKKAGAIILLVSNTPELCLGFEANNHLVGTTNNPYDTTKSAAGSSGGEGSLLGAGASLVGVGSDLGGSIRLPSMFNGVFGHKPTPRVVPLDGHYPIATDDRIHDFLVIGPMTRYAEDLPLMMRVLAHPHFDFDSKVDLGSLTVFHMEEVGTFSVLPVQKEIRSGIRKAVNFLKDNCGCRVSDYKFDGLRDGADISASVMADVDDIPYILQDPDDPKKNSNLYLELVKLLFGKSSYTYNSLSFYVIKDLNGGVPRVKYQKYLKKWNQLRNDFITQLGKDGVFLYPTFPVSAYHHTQSPWCISGVIYLIIFNCLGLPSTNVPIGFDNKGMPIGIQVVAAPYQDRLCLAVAGALEKCFGGWKPPKSH